MTPGQHAETDAYAERMRHGLTSKCDDADLRAGQNAEGEGRPLTLPGYTAVIRTCNSERTIGQTIASLEQQTIAPTRYIIVDSGSTDRTLDLLPSEAVVHRYQGRQFNYSDSLNQGICYVETDYTLVISSHTSLTNRDAIAFAIELLDSSPNVGAAYFSLAQPKQHAYDLIDKAKFTGFNGVFNTCGMYRSSLLRKRQFRPEVFSAEDQEWSKWLLENEHKLIARIAGGGLTYSNPNGQSLKKWLLEWLAVATFTEPKILTWYRIARIAGRIVKPRVSARDRCFHAVLAVCLVFCRITPDALKPRFLRNKRTSDRNALPAHPRAPDTARAFPIDTN